MSFEKHIIFQEKTGRGGDVGEIILNRPQALNALSLEMIRDLFDQLVKWAAATHIKAVIIKSNNGRAFCVGGDIRLLYEHRDIGADKQVEFFWHEYRLNAAIHHFPKPFIAFLNGITMGGGAGVSVHGSHRIVTENFCFAMPETKIGFFPDIGASYFLNKCPKKIGLYLGLTGAIINATESLECAIATHMVQSARLAELETALIDTQFSSNNPSEISEVIQSFSLKPESSNSHLHEDTIEECFSKANVDEILMSLKQSTHAWCNAAAKDLEARSPTSLKVTFEQLKRAEKMKFDDILQMDFDMAREFLKQHDFYEGVRAIIIDKDKKPQWQPQNLSDVKDTDIANYFAPKGQKLIEEKSLY